MLNSKSQPRQNTPVKDHRSATEYRLSFSSNPGSRRSSLGTANNIDGSDAESVVNTYLLPQIRELSDAVITLDSNFTQMNFIHESLVDLNESISALLYGLMCNSWCVDFPNMPHDTGAEINFIQTLRNLEEEKQQILVQITRLHAENAKPATESSIQDSTRKRANPYALSMRTSPQRQWSPETAQPGNGLDYHEEDNTGASFISNPAVVDTNASAAERSRRLRRKSILHTMRSSGAGTKEIMGPEKRRSLAVSASRIVDPLRRTASRSGPSRIAPSSSKDLKTPKKWSTSDSRPPFR
ncbi:LANO_0H20450g1_1 [Lachancea nothofagi CBS 11611]|uniref:DASH complex subunit DAM1 n=1 Tax=Lachancea nothofagi CBS 11611 TaxID=1266666 RepID=A0A1G4KN92_9SACH|nr:LANO_0H20450g1_1 [Lachancea nothofagi CBS 11611]